MQLGSMFISNCNNALHVSDAFCVHPQEHLKTVVAAKLHHVGSLYILTYDARKLKYKILIICYVHIYYTLSAHSIYFCYIL